MVDLPSSTAQPQPKPNKRVFLTTKADGDMVLGEQPVTHDSLGAALRAATRDDREQRIFCTPTRPVTYDTIIGAMTPCPTLRPIAKSCRRPS